MAQGLEESRFDAEAAGQSSSGLQPENLYRHFCRGRIEIDDVRGRPDAAKYPAERQQSCFVQLDTHLRARILGDDHAKAAGLTVRAYGERGANTITPATITRCP